MNPGHQNPNLDRPAGPVDPEVSILAARTPDGKPIGMLANYSLHYVGGTRLGEVTADYYGVYNETLAELLGAEKQVPPFVSLMSNGTSGNINNVDFANPPQRHGAYEKMTIVGRDVAKKVFEAYQGIKWHDNVVLGAAFEEITLALRKPTAEQLEWANKTLAESDASDARNKLPRIYAERTILQSTFPAEYNFPLQSFRIGELGISTFPLEVFAETGLDIKERSPLKPAFTISLAHGYFGYLPTPEQHPLGGYETWLGTSKLEEQASVKMTGQLLSMLQRLKEIR